MTRKELKKMVVEEVAKAFEKDGRDIIRKEVKEVITKTLIQSLSETIVTTLKGLLSQQDLEVPSIPTRFQIPKESGTALGVGMDVGFSPQTTSGMTTGAPVKKKKADIVKEGKSDIMPLKERFKLYAGIKGDTSRPASSPVRRDMADEDIDVDSIIREAMGR